MRAELEIFIKLFIPNGWVGPIREFDFAPLISDEDFEIIKGGKLPDKPDYKKWYVKDAVKAWWVKEKIEEKQ